MTADKLQTWLNDRTDKANALLESAVDLAASGDLDSLIEVLASLRDEAFACGLIASDLARLRLH